MLQKIGKTIKKTFKERASRSQSEATRWGILKRDENKSPAVESFGNQMGFRSPVIGKRGQLSFWSPFEGMFIAGQGFNKPKFGGNNFFMTGSSGSGKKPLCNEVIASTLSTGGKVFVLDNDRSYAHLCNLLGGEDIRFDFSDTFSMNPFTNIPEGDSHVDEHNRKKLLNVLCNVVELMAFPSGMQTDVEGAFLKVAIYCVWESKKSKGTIDDIYHYLNSQNNALEKEIAEKLIDFTTIGAYGEFFNLPANIDFLSRFVVLNTDNLEEPMRSVMISSFLFQVWQKLIQSDCDKPSLILLNESQDWLNTMLSSDFIEAFALSTRKCRASLGIVTHSILQSPFGKGTVGEAAWECSDWKIIFNQEGKMTSDLGDHPQLGEYTKKFYQNKLLRSLRLASDFSDFMLCHMNLPDVLCRLSFDKQTTTFHSVDINELYTAKSENIEMILEKQIFNDPSFERAVCGRE